MKAAAMSRFEVLKRNQDGSKKPFKLSTIDQKGGGNANVAVKCKKRSYAKLDMKFEISQGKVVVDLPIRTKSEANCFEPWRIKHRRHKEQQRIVAAAIKPHADKIKMPCRIMLTRFAPKELDVFDNLPMSFKYIADAVCAIITGENRPGKADGDERIIIACDQIKSKDYGIRIEIESQCRTGGFHRGK